MSGVTRARWCTPRQWTRSGALGSRLAAMTGTYAVSTAPESHQHSWIALAVHNLAGRSRSVVPVVQSRRHDRSRPEAARARPKAAGESRASGDAGRGGAGLFGQGI